MKTLKTLLILLGFAVQSFAQSPAPTDPQSGPILVKNAVIHVGNGQVIDNGYVAFDQGKITEVGTGTIAESGYEVIDAAGKHVYPGFVLPASALGLIEVGSLKATRDASEIGISNPNARTIISYNTDSELIPTFRFNGILTTQVAPGSGRPAGSSSVVRLDAWNWEDAAIKTDDGMHMSWPPKSLGPRWWMGETERRPNEDYGKQIQELNELFDNAKSYNPANGTNLRLAALQGLFTGEQQLFISANKADEIISSVEFAKSYGIKNIVIKGARDANYVLDFIKDNDVSIILHTVHSMPYHRESDYDMPVKMAKLLKDKGIPYCLGYFTGMVANQRNLGFLAGATVRHGLTKEEALQSITLNAAQILKVDDQLGSLEKGKNATFFISEGDALDMRSQIITHAYIDGRLTSFDAMQQRLYEKYKKKYDQ